MISDPPLKMLQRAAKLDPRTVWFTVFGVEGPSLVEAGSPR